MSFIVRSYHREFRAPDSRDNARSGACRLRGSSRVRTASATPLAVRTARLRLVPPVSARARRETRQQKSTSNALKFARRLGRELDRKTHSARPSTRVPASRARLRGGVRDWSEEALLPLGEPRLRSVGVLLRSGALHVSRDRVQLPPVAMPLPLEAMLLLANRALLPPRPAATWTVSRRLSSAGAFLDGSSSLYDGSSTWHDRRSVGAADRARRTSVATWLPWGGVAVSAEAGALQTTCDVTSSEGELLPSSYVVLTSSPVQATREGRLRPREDASRSASRVRGRHGRAPGSATLSLHRCRLAPRSTNTNAHSPPRAARTEAAVITVRKPAR